MRLNKQVLISFILVTLGSFIYAATVNAVMIPNNMGEGGVAGVALLSYYLFGLNPGGVNLIINAILLIIGWRYLERETLYWTFYAVLMVSFFLDYAHFLEFVPQNTLLAPLVSGVFSGLGLGLVLLGRGTTAGLDIIAKIAEQFLGIKVPITIAVFDFIIIIPFVFTIGLENVILSLVSILVMTRMMTFVLEGFNPRKSLMIISQEHEAIATAISQEIDRGITVLEGSGFYSRQHRPVLYTVIDSRQLIQVQRIIYRYDQTAFVSIADVHQVIGEGFTFYLDQEEG